MTEGFAARAANAASDLILRGASPANHGFLTRFQVRRGLGKMPAFDERISDNDLDVLVAYPEALRHHEEVFAGGDHAYRLEFCASPVIGANAFALPGGTVVMTDELTDLSENDDEVLAVLAHEIGHVKHRHSLRQLLQNTATGLIIAGITGDLTSITSLAAAVPTFLMQAKYSRVHEAEADRFALELMREAGIDPHHFPAILNRLQAEDEDDVPAPSRHSRARAVIRTEVACPSSQ